MIDDVLGIICLAVVMGIVSIQGGSGTDWGKIGLISVKCIGFYLAASAVGLIIAGIVAKGLKSFKSASVYAVLAFGLAMIISGIFEQQGLAMIIGAYVPVFMFAIQVFCAKSVCRAKESPDLCSFPSAIHIIIVFLVCRGQKTKKNPGSFR